jgi:hypothetical protein
MTAVDLVTLRLTWAEDVAVRPAPHLLRGAIAQRFAENPLVHQHDGEHVVYRYPRIQYRWDRTGPWLLGLGDGAHFLAQTDWSGMQLRLADCPVTVRDATCAFRRHEIRSTPRLKRYRFAAPWLPLSQENYRKYQHLSRTEQRGELDRLAVAGVLLGLRGFGVDFGERLYAGFETKFARPCRYKGVDLLGFTGQLLVNVDLPDGFAIGRAVSHGYGWTISAQEEHCNDAPGHD